MGKATAKLPPREALRFQPFSCSFGASWNTETLADKAWQAPSLLYWYPALDNEVEPRQNAWPKRVQLLSGRRQRFGDTLDIGHNKIAAEL